MIQKFEKINYFNKKCSELPYFIEKQETFNTSLENWNCIDFDDVYLGGNWDGISFMEFQFTQPSADLKQVVIAPQRMKYKSSCLLTITQLEFFTVT